MRNEIDDIFANRIRRQNRTTTIQGSDSMTGEHRVHIQCSDLFKIYKRAELEVVALRGLDMEVAHGEFLAIIGSSGSGKTTLLNHILTEQHG